MELSSLAQIEHATSSSRQELLRLGTADLFLVGVLVFAGVTFQGVPNAYLLIAAAMVGGYMAMNIGANDVANAVGPLAGIFDSIMSRGVSTKATIPLWIMMIGALGIAFGLALYGPKLIRTVGSEITELDQARALCIAMAAAITVIIASQLGMPISSTHLAIGAVFGVGFMREAIKTNYHRLVQEIRDHHIVGVNGGDRVLHYPRVLAAVGYTGFGEFRPSRNR